MEAVTGEQIRAARALARMSQLELATAAHVSLETVKRLEGIRGPVAAHSRTLAKLSQGLASAGVLFDGRGGLVRIGVGLDPVAASAMEGRDSGLQRLIYCSVGANDDAVDPTGGLAQILASSRRNNARLRVTGVLLAASGRFLQILEGPGDSVAQLYGSIASDCRHHGLQLVEHRSIASRQFPDWGLCCGWVCEREPSLTAEPAFRGGFHPENLSPASALGLLAVVRDLQRLRSLPPAPPLGAAFAPSAPRTARPGATKTRRP